MNRPLRFLPVCIYLFLFFGLVLNTYSQCPTLPPVNGRAIQNTTNGVCSAVSTEVSYTVNFDSNTPSIGQLQLVFFWGDGAVDYVELTEGLKDYVDIKAAHNFPINSDCEYFTQVMMYYDGSACTDTYQTRTINSYRTEQYNQGLVQLLNPTPSPAPTPANVIEVCQGVNISAVFNDMTNFNCNANYVVAYPVGQTIVNPNTRRKWIQLLYNTKTTAGPRIPNVSVGGVPVTGAGGVDIINRYQDSRFPSGVKPLTAPVVFNDPRRPVTELITAAGGFGAGFPQVGDIFEVTIRYWNVCNPYSNNSLAPNTPNNGDFVNGDNAPIESIALIKIVSAPSPPTTSNLTYCNGTTPAPFTVSGMPSGSTVRWYRDNAGVPGTLITSNTASAGGVGTLALSSYPGGITNTTAGVYTVWASYLGASASQTCESPKVAVVRSIRENLVQPGTITNPSGNVFPVCAGTTGLTFTAGSTGPASSPTPIGGAWQYLWTVTSGLSISGPANGQSVNIDVKSTAVTGNQTVTVVKRYLTNDNAATPSNCTTTSRTFTFSVSALPVGGTISGGTTPICLGSSTGVMTLSGHSGTISKWQVDVDGGGFTDIANTTTTYSEVPAVPGVYTYRAVLTSGNCTPVTSGTRVITVNPRPDIATISGGGNVCSGTNVNLKVDISGTSVGLPPYTVVLADGGSGLTVNNYASGANIVVAPTATTTYTITSVTDARGCTVVTRNGSATVNIGNPISATLSAATTTICPGASTDLSVVIVGSSSTLPPYTVTYRANGAPQTPITNYNSGDVITVSPLVNTTYTLLSVTDANGCPATTLSGNPTVNVGAPLVSAVFSGAGNVCQNTAKNLTLTINGGVPPYSITVTPTSGPSIVNSSYTSGGNIPVPTSAVGSIDYNITLITDNCGNSLPVASITGNPQTVTVTPVPIGAANTLVPAICSKASVLVDIFNTSVASPQGNGVNSTYTWTASYPAGITGGPASGTGNIGSTAFALSNLTGGQLIATFTVTPRATSGSCFGTNFIIRIPVDPEPVASTPKTVAAICSNDNVNVNIFNTSMATAAGGNNVSSSYSWVATYPAGLTGGPANGTGDIGSTPFTLVNKTGGQLTAQFRITPTAVTGSCLGADFRINVPVNPEPVGATMITVPSVCSGIPFSINPQTTSVAVAAGGNGVSSTFTWTAVYDAGISGGAASGAGNITGTLSNTSGGVLNATYTVTPQSTTSPTLCFGDPFTIIIPISSAAAITTQPANTPVCATGSTSTGTVSFSVVATGPGLTYQWQQKIGAAAFTNLSDDATYSGTSSPTGVLTITGVTTAMNNYQYRVILTTTGSCSVNSSPAVLTVHPLPVVNSPTISECSDAPGASTRVVDLTSYNGNVKSGTGFTFTWWQDAAATASPITPGPSGGQDQSYLVSNGDVLYARVHDVATGCDNIGMVTFQINTTPVANAILGPANVCVNTNQVLYQVSNNNISSGAKYSWNIPAGYTVFGGGSGAVAGGGAGPFGNDPYVLLVFSSAVDATISVIEKSADNCVGLSNDLAIHVATGPSTVPISGGTIFCKNQSGVVFEVPQNPTSNYIWSVSSGATIVGPAAGTGLNKIIVNFNNLPSATVDVTENNSSGCPANYPTLTISLVDSPIMTGPFTGYSICSETQPSVVLDLNTVVSVPSTFTWFVKSISPNITGAVVNQTGSGPLTHAPPLKNISGTDGTITYTVTPTATSAPNCVGVSADYTIVVKPEPVVDLITDKSVCPSTIINGNTFFDFKSNVSGATISWTNSNPAIGLTASSGTGNPSFVVSDNLTGADIVSTLTVTASSNGCTSSGANSKTFTFTVRPRPVVDVIADIIVCPGEAVSVPNFTANTSGETYAWTNDNTAIGLGASGPGNIPGFFATANNTGVDVVANINVKATLATCEGPIRAFKIIIKPQPVVNPVSDREFCPGEPISINLDSNVPTATINWSNSNTGIGVLASGTGSPLTGTAAVNNTGADIVGTITVSAAANGCTSAGANLKTFKIIIKPTPIVDAVTDIVVCSGKTIPAIVFSSNVTAGGVIFDWTNDNPAINLPASGFGSINAFTAAVNTSGVPMVANLSVKGVKNLCSGPSTTFRITVNPEPVVAAIGPQIYCPGDAINIPLSSLPATAAINWINSNPSIGLAASGTGDITFTAPSNGTGSNITTTIDVTATENGCISTGANAKSFQIIIRPTPIVNNVTDVVVCSGGTIPSIVFSANTGGGELFSWTNDNTAVGKPATGSGTITSYAAPVNISGTSIVANFTVAASLNSCPGPTKTFKITIHPEPVVTPLSNLSFCAGEPVNIPLASNVPGAAITWTNTNTLIGLGIGGNGDIGYTAPANNTGSDIVGTITVRASLNGCSSAGANMKSFDITIKPTPIIDPVSNITVCSGDPISLISFSSNVVSGGVTFNWTNDNTAINLAASGTGSIAAFTAAVNTTNAPFVANISVTGSKNLCSGPTRSFTITVNPKPVMSSSLNNSVCSGDPTGLVLSTTSSSVPALTYNIISRTSPGLITVSAASVPPSGAIGVSSIYLSGDKFKNTTNGSLPVTYKVRPVGTIAGCIGDETTIIIMVDPEPKAPVITTIERCSGTSINYDIQTAIDNTTGGGNALANTQFTYVISSVLPSGNDLTPAAFPGSNGRSLSDISDDPITETFQNFTGHDVTITYTITPYSSDPERCAGTPFELRVVYHPEPVGTDFIDPLCATTLNHDIQAQITNAIPSEFTYTVISDNGAVPAGPNRTVFSSAAITDAYINNSGTVANMTYTITARATAAPNCGSTTVPSTFKYIARIFPTPNAAGGTLTPICSDETVSIDPQSFVTNSVTITKYDWEVSYAASLNSNGTLPASGTKTFNATGLINFTLTNKTSGQLPVTIKITPYSGGCPGAEFTVVQPIDAEPVMFNNLNTSKCSGEPYGLDLATNGVYAGAVTYDVYVDEVPSALTGGRAADPLNPIGGGNSAANVIFNDTYTNNTAAPLIVKYRVIPRGGGCEGDAKPIEFTVKPSPVLLVTPPPAMCSTNSETPSVTNIVLGTDGISVNAATYRITNIEYARKPVVGPMDPFTTTPSSPDFTVPAANKDIGNIGDINLLKQDQFRNKTADPFVVRFTIVPISAGNCEGAPGTVSITVNPEPILDPALSPTPICSGDKIDPTGNFFQLRSVPATSVASTLFIIKAINSNGLTAGTSNALIGSQIDKDGIDNDSYINIVSSSFVPVVYTIIPISADGCRGEPETVTIRVNPAPGLKAGLDKLVCNNTNSGIVLVDDSPTSAPASQYRLAGITVGPANTPITPGATAGGLTANAGNRAIGATAGTSLISTDRYINNTSDRIVVRYQIVAIAATGCEATAFVTLTVEPAIISTSTITDPDICSGTPIAISFNTSSYANLDPTNPVITYSYSMTYAGPETSGISGNTVGNNLLKDASGTDISDVLVNSTNAAIQVKYRITPRAIGAAGGLGCAGTVQEILLTVQPRPKINPIADKTVCEDNSVNLSLVSPTTPSTGVIKFRLTSVVPETAAITGFTAANTLLANNTVLGDMLSNSDVVQRYVDYTFEPLNVDATDATICANGTPITVRVTVNPRPNVTPSATALEICSSESVEVNLVTDTDQSGTIVKWTALASSVEVVGESNGAGDLLFQTLINNGGAVQTVDYTVTPSFNGCDGPSRHIIVTVNPMPKFNSSPLPTLPNKITVCAGTTFNLNLAPLATGATTFRWEVTDVNGIGTVGQFDGVGTSISQVFVNTSDASATLLYQITPIFVSAGKQCEGLPRIVNVSVAPTITAAFISVDEGVCEGTPVFLTFELHGQAPFDFVYSATDATGTVNKTISKSGSVKVEKVTPTLTTVYKILSAKDALGCPVTFSPEPTVTITVYKKVTAGWTATIPPFIGGTSVVGFTNTSTPVDGAVFDYNWSFGTDGYVNPLSASGVGPFAVTYTRPGDHYVSLTASNKAAPVDLGCESTFAAKITIPVLPLMADFEFDPKAACFPTTIKVTKNTSTGAAMDWVVRDANNSIAATSNAPLPEFLITNPGKYTISLRTYDPFTHQEAFAPTAGKSFTIYDNPVASFDVRPTLVYVPDTELTTFNFTTGATEYLWDFGDGSTSTEQEPKYTYKIEGIYDITLVAINDHGDGAVCMDTLSRKITAKQGGVTKVPNAFTPSPNGPTGGVAGNNTFNDVFLPIVKGAEEFNMQVFDRWGNLIFESNNSNIGWDGYDKNGKLMPAGVYVYKLTVRLSDGQRSTQLGDITMIR